MGAKAKVRFAANHLTLESEMDRDLKAELKFTFCKAKFIINQFDFCTVLLLYTIIYELTYGAGEKFTEIQFKLQQRKKGAGSNSFGPKFQLFSVPRSSEWWRRLLRHLWQHKIFNNYCTGSVPVSEAEKLESHRCLNFTDGQNMKQPQNK